MPHDRINWQRIRVGCRYVEKYLVEGLLSAYKFNHSPLKPLEVFCEITYKCNLKCPTCFRWTTVEDRDELGLEDWKAAISKLEKWVGTFNLFVSGGEPFLRDDMIEIIKFASGLGITVSVVSNGSLIDKTLAKRIVSSGLFGLTLSLNSMNPKTHNKTRGTAGSFDEVMRAIENLRERGKMRLNIAATVMAENINDLVGLAEFVKKEGLDSINYQPLMPASAIPILDEKGNPKKLPPGKFYQTLGREPEVVKEVFTKLKRMRENGYPINNMPKHMDYMVRYLQNHGDPEVMKYPCKIGPKNFVIDPFGNVRICPMMEPIGNIRDDLPQAFWNSDKALEQRENIRGCKEPCRLFTCNFKELDLWYQLKKMYMRG